MALSAHVNRFRFCVSSMLDFIFLLDNTGCLRTGKTFKINRQEHTCLPEADCSKYIYTQIGGHGIKHLYACYKKCRQRLGEAFAMG